MPFRRFGGRKLIAAICCLLISYAVLQFFSVWFELSMHRPPKNINPLLSNEEILMALSELIEFSEKATSFKAGQDALRLAKECQIPTLPIWPEGIKYPIWVRPNCGKPEPFRVFNGTIYFDEKSMSCNAKLFGSYSLLFIY